MPPTVPSPNDSTPDSTGLWESPSTSGPDVGDVIGPYRLIDILGRGGMGCVYLAEQEQPIRRRVALKALHAGADASETLLRRFEFEADALSMMSHPGVAAVLDAGRTDAGAPYVVMEYVKGRPINTYADELRLPIRDRLRLFLEVCDAIRHAHGRGVLHRDLKPSNILITDEVDRSRARVIDWGLAAADGKELAGAGGQPLGTPEYMSPEQAANDAVDVRTDVYALGVVLYELACGRLPFDSDDLRSRSTTEMAEFVRSTAPDPPSRRLTSQPDAERIATSRDSTIHRLERALAREVDWIVMKAISRHAEDRYQSVDALADDVRRCLDGDPIVARRSFGYFISTALRRSKRARATAAAIVLAVILGFTGGAWFVANHFEIVAQLQQTRTDLSESLEKNEDLQASFERVREENQAIRLDYEGLKQSYDAAAPDSRFAAVASISVAMTEARSGRLDAARRRLDAASDLRGTWAWRHVAAVAGADTAFELQSGFAVSAVASGDLARLAVVEQDATRVYDVRTGAVRHTLPRAALHPDAIAMHPTRPLLAWIADDARGALSIMRTDTGERISIARITTPVRSVQFSPKGDRVAVIDANGAIVTLDPDDPESVRRRLDPDDAEFLHVEYGPRGERILTVANNGFAAIRDAQAMELELGVQACAASPHAIAWSPSGQRFAVMDVNGHTQILDASNGELIGDFSMQFTAGTSLLFGERDDRIIIASPESVRIMDGVAGSEIARFNASAIEVTDARRRGDLIAIEDESGVVRLVSTTTGEVIRRLDASSGRLAGAIFDDRGDRLLTVGLAGDVRLTHLEGQPDVVIAPTADRWIGAAAWTGSAILAGSGYATIHAGDDADILGVHRLDLLDPADGGALRAYGVFDGAIRRIDVAPGGDAAIVLSDGDAYCVELDSGRRTRLESDGARILDVAAGAERAFGVTDDRRILAWARDAGWRLDATATLSSPRRPVSIDADVAGRRVVVGQREPFVQVFDQRSLSRLAEIEAHRAHPEGVRLSADGVRLISCGGFSATITHLDSNRIEHEVRTDGRTVLASDVLASDSMLIWGDRRGVTLRDIETGQDLFTIPLASNEDGPRVVEDMRNIVVSPDGQRVAVVHDGRLFLLAPK
ncbi:MAG: serine/threonine-protein kinase [Phycisphaerales bacterium]